MPKFYTILFLVVVVSFGYAQKGQTVNVCGEADYAIPENVSREAAKNIVLERARLDALVGAFGQNLSEINATTIANGNGKSNVDFRSYNEGEIKGEWLGDTKEPEIRFVSDDKTGMVTIFAKVCGRAREKQFNLSELQTHVLRNNINDASENTSFISERDVMFVRFRSSDDGYLSIYIVDDMKNVVRLFPYQNDPDKKMKIVKDKTYILFSLNEKDDPFMPPQERYTQALCTLFTNKDVEYDQLYIIFSKKEYSLPVENADYRVSNAEHDFLTEGLSFVQFEKWLMRNRANDPLMQVILKEIEIKRH